MPRPPTIFSASIPKRVITGTLSSSCVDSIGLGLMGKTSPSAPLSAPVAAVANLMLQQQQQAQQQTLTPSPAAPAKRAPSSSLSSLTAPSQTLIPAHSPSSSLSSLVNSATMTKHSISDSHASHQEKISAAQDLMDSISNSGIASSSSFFGQKPFAKRRRTSSVSTNVVPPLTASPAQSTPKANDAVASGDGSASRAPSSNLLPGAPAPSAAEIVVRKRGRPPKIARRLESPTSAIIPSGATKHDDSLEQETPSIPKPEQRNKIAVMEEDAFLLLSATSAVNSQPEIVNVNNSSHSVAEVEKQLTKEQEVALIPKEQNSSVIVKEKKPRGRPPLNKLSHQNDVKQSKEQQKEKASVEDDKKPTTEDVVKQQLSITEEQEAEQEERKDKKSKATKKAKIELKKTATKGNSAAPKASAPIPPPALSNSATRRRNQPILEIKRVWGGKVHRMK